MTAGLQSPELYEPDTVLPKKRMGPVAKTLIVASILLGLSLVAGAVTIGATYAKGGPQALLSLAAGIPIPDSVRESAFNKVVKEAGGEYAAGKSESAIAAEARALCKRLDAGESIGDVATSASTGVGDLQGFGAVMGTGIIMFCPAHEPALQTYLTSIGQVDRTS